MELLDRMRGCLLGLAVGDAVGVTNEFKLRGSFEPIIDMVGGGAFYLEAGEWTDDTSMALCLARSLIECNGFDPNDQLAKYLSWYRDGYMSSIGRCFDIGYQTQAALQYYEKTGDYIMAGYAGRRSDRSVSAGNGSLMRLAPIPMYFYPNRLLVRVYAGASSLTTHANHLCVDACQTYASLICDAFDGMTKKQICVQPLLYAQQIGVGKDIDEIKGSGFVTESLEAAIWCFYHTDSFEEAILTAANLGDDADTTAAICGQLAGAYYGKSGIPQKWLDKLVQCDKIEQIATSICIDVVNRQK